MTERTKKIDIEIQEGQSGLSSFGGPCSIVTLFFKVGMDRKIDATIRIRGRVPSKVFGANVAWWNVAVLAMNLNNILKNFFLPAIYRCTALARCVF